MRVALPAPDSADAAAFAAWEHTTLALDQAAYVLLVLDPVFLAYFASIFPTRRGLAEHSTLLGLTLATAGGLAALVVLAYPSIEACCGAGPAPGPLPFPGRVLLVGWVVSLYTYTLAMLWSALADERSDVMAAQVRLVALGASVPLLTRIALAPEDLHLAGVPGAPLRLVSLALLAAAYVAGRRWTLAHALPPRRDELQRSWDLVAVLLAIVVPFWLLGPLLGGSSVTLAPGASIDLGDWAFSVRWFVFGLFIVAGFVRVGAFDADPRLLERALVFLAAVTGALAVAFAAAAGGPLGAAAAALVLVVLAAGPLRDRLRPMLPVRSQRPAPPGQSRDGADAGDVLSTRVGGFATPSPSPSSARDTSRYRVLGEVARSATGVVLLAEDGRDGRRVVLKRLAAAGTDVAALQREVRVAKRVSHPNLVAIHGLADIEGELYLVEEFVEGGSLRERLAAGAPPRDDALRIARDVMRGLAALHEAGVVHRDLKPANVLLDRQGAAKLADFGIARFAGDVAGTTAGAPIGTLAYMAPEQAAGQPATRRSDVYAAAAVLYEVFTGRHHLGEAAQSAPRLLLALTSEAPEPTWSGVPAPLREILSKGLAREPARRYADGAAMLRAFEGATKRVKRPAR